MRRRSLLPAIPCLFVLVAETQPAFAQRTTGTIVGTVTDESGGVLPGVAVTLKGEQIAGIQTSTSNAEGRYRFAALPPGAYNLSFALSGFSTLNRTGIRVGVGATVEENASLKVTQLTEEITVVGEAPVVDTQTNTVSTNYDKDWVRNAPVRRFSFFDLINAAPGVTQSTNGGFSNASSSSFGSGTDENSYQLDGTDFTAPLTGEAWPYPNTDAIEEIEVLSLGAPAEYGNLQGAVFNVVTRQGGNDFHGDANFYFQDQGLTGNNTNDKKLTLSDGTSFFADACPTEATPDRRCPYNRNKYNDLTLQLSGPIVRDKLWFFASYQYQRDFRAQPGVDPAFPVKEAADRVFGKLNWQINPKNKLQIAYHDDYYELPFQATAFTAPSSIQLESGHNPSPGVTFTSVLSDKTYVEARYSGFYGKDHADPLNGGPRVNPRFYDFDTGNITGGIYYWYDGDIWKNAATLKLSHFADSFLGGSHDFKFGVQYNSGGSDYTTGPNDYIYTYNYTYTDYYGQSTTYPVGYGYTQLPYHYGGNVRSVGAYVDDTFRVSDRLTLNVGLRYDNSRASIPSFPILDRDGNETGASSKDLGTLYTWNTVSPRLGFNWKLTGDGRSVLRAHYGRYYRGVITGEFSSTGPSVSPVFLGDYNFDTGQLENLELISDTSNLRVDSQYKSPYTDQFIVSLEREIVKNLGFSLHYVHKRGEKYGAWRDARGMYVSEPLVDDQEVGGPQSSGKTLTVQRLVSDPSQSLFQLTNPAGLYSRVNAVTGQLTKRMSNRWQLTSALTLSRATGRLASSLNDLEAAQRSGVRGDGKDFGKNPNDFINTDGRLIQDRPVVFKTQLVWEAPAGFTLGANFVYQSGRPWARTIRTDLGVPVEFLAEKVDGSRRVPAWKLLDLRLQKEFSLGGKAHVAVFADALNLLNNDANESVAAREGTNEGFGQPTLFLDPRRLMVGAKFRF